MTIQTLTLEQHFANIKERTEKRNLGQLPELNAFAEEMQRDRTLDQDQIELETPRSIKCPFAKQEFFAGYYDEKAYEFYIELQKAGLKAQDLRNLAPRKKIGFRRSRDHYFGAGRELYQRFSEPIDRVWLIENQDKLEIEILKPYNEIFGATFRLKKEFLDKKDGLEIMGVTNYDLSSRITEAVESDTARLQRPTYLVGTFKEGEREMTPKEREIAKRKVRVRKVFGFEPPEQEQILQELCKIHRISFERGRIDLEIVAPKKLTYPVPRGILYMYQDAKASDLFKELEFGILQKTRVTDPVLMGTYQGFRIPLAYWI